jgi:hypothetical protein
MGTIYEIICWTTGRRYVGKTTRTKKKRLQDHESNFRTGKNHTYSVFQVLEHGNYDIYELEKVEDEDKLSDRELYYIQHIDCVNTYDGTFDMTEYMKKRHEANREVRLKKMKEYHEANREKILEKAKEKITCECGSIFRKSDKARHEKTKIHLNFLKNNSTNKDEKEINISNGCELTRNAPGSL